MGFQDLFPVSPQLRGPAAESRAGSSDLPRGMSSFPLEPRRRPEGDKSEKLRVPDASNEMLSMGFTANLRDRRSFRCLNVLDDFNREAPGIEVDFSLPSERAIRALERVIE